MKNKNMTKIILDMLMVSLFAVLLFAYNTGLIFHEIAGILIVFLFALHLILNRRWITAVTKNIISGKVKPKPLQMYILNIGLLAGVIIITVTGLMISTVVFPAGSYEPGIVTLHKWSAYTTGGLIVIHMVLHAKYIITMLQKILENLKHPMAKRVIGSTAAIVMVAGIVYSAVISAINKDEAIIPDDGKETSIVIKETVSEEDEEDEEEEKKETVSSEPSESSSQTETVTLSEFLSKMFCTACGRHCPLSNPQCRRSARLIEQAEAEYQSLYGDI